jgi:hypothetical protein
MGYIVYENKKHVKESFFYEWMALANEHKFNNYITCKLCLLDAKKH